MRGRSIKLSAPRRLVCDLMRFSKSVPRVAVQRRMNLATLQQARSDAGRRVSWTAIMVRGYALLAEEVPELRRAYAVICKYRNPRWAEQRFLFKTYLTELKLDQRLEP